MKKEVTLKIEASPVFEKSADIDTKVVINRGGAGSSKSYSIAQLLIIRALNYPGIKIFMARKTQPSVRYSVKPLIEEIFSEMGLLMGPGKQIERNKTSLDYIFNNGSLIHLGGVDNPEKVKSTDWNYIWMEEATDFAYDDFMQLRLRIGRNPKVNKQHGFKDQIFLTFNPIDQFHWIKTQVLDCMDDVTEIHSTYKDNPFLPERSYL
jgi:phage terminase large subunit